MQQVSNPLSSFQGLELKEKKFYGLLNTTFHSHGEEIPSGSQQDSSLTSAYRESLYAQLLGDDNSCITFCHFQKSVHYNHLLDVYFNVPYKVTKHKTYKVNVILRKCGWYPKGKYIDSSNKCTPITFTFMNEDKQSDSFIHSIIFRA